MCERCGGGLRGNDALVNTRCVCGAFVCLRCEGRDRELGQPARCASCIHETAELTRARIRAHERDEHPIRAFYGDFDEVT
jgi:hypothetical protein